MSHAAWAQAPARLNLEKSPAPVAGARDNQQVADGIAQQLRQSPNLRQYNIDISVKGGTVELIGNVGDTQQREQAQKIAMSAPGVTNVVDKLTTGAIQRVSTTQEPGLLPAPQPAAPAACPHAAANADGDTASDARPDSRACGRFRRRYLANRLERWMPMATWAPPMKWARRHCLAMLGRPTLPTTTTSRVAYPEAYPACAWPFIGTVLPLPPRSARLAVCEAGMAGRPLVVQQDSLPARFLARPLLVTG